LWARTVEASPLARTVEELWRRLARMVEASPLVRQR